MSDSPPANQTASALDVFEEVRLCLERVEAAERDPAPERLVDGLRACAEALARLNDTPVGDLACDRMVAAVWLKRGHLLERRAPERRISADLTEALRCHDTALRVLLPHAPVDVEAARVCAVIWSSRGNVLQRLGGDTARAEAARSYRHAIDGFEADPAEAPERHVQLAAARLNLALLHREGGEPPVALERLRALLTDLSPHETHAAGARAVGLRARELLVETLLRQIEAEPGAAEDCVRERVMEAAAAVGEGLALLAGESADADRARRATGARLFALGAELYWNFGDGQLAPYLAAHACDPAFPERAEAAAAAIARAREELAGRGFEELAGEAGERAAAHLAAMREVETRLAHLGRFSRAGGAN